MVSAIGAPSGLLSSCGSISTQYRLCLTRLLMVLMIHSCGNHCDGCACVLRMWEHGYAITVVRFPSLMTATAPRNPFEWLCYMWQYDTPYLISLMILAVVW
jgi:hypothetical protein